jgi:hypothetical protein
VSFYTDKAALVRRLLAKFGADATVKQIVTGEYDPSTGTASTTVTNHAAKAAVFDYDAKLIDGLVIQKGDKQVFAEAITYVPTSVDKFTWGGVDHQIIAVKPLAPALVNVMYELQVRV